MVLIKLGDHVIDTKIVKKYKINYEKLDGSGTKRNLQGNMRRQVIANKIKVETETVDELEESIIRPILNYLTQDTFSAEVYDTKTGEIKTISCYASVPSLEISFTETDKIYYSPFTIGLIEL